jgi:SRSO17 transposase
VHQQWLIEEDHQLSKQSTGLDAGQVIRWRSWHRWTAICLLAYLYLAVAVAVQRQQEASASPRAPDIERGAGVVVAG